MDITGYSLSSPNIIEKGRFDLALFLLVIYTVFFEYFFVTSYGAVIEILVVLFLATVTIVCNQNSFIYRPKNIVFFSWSLLFIWIILRSHTLASRSILRIFLGIVFFYWGGRENTTQHNLKTVNLLLNCSLLIGFSVIIEFFMPSLLRAYKVIIYGIDRYNLNLLVLEKGYYTGALYQVGFTAFFIVVVIGVLAYVPKYTTVKKYLLIGSMFIALLMTNKRAHLLYLFLSFLAVYLLTAPRNKMFMRIVRISILACVAIALIFAFMQIFPNLSISIRTQATIVGLFAGDDVSSGRINLYTLAIKLWRNSSPLIGIGWGEYVNQSPYISISGGKNQVHNVFLQTLCESGVIGCVLFTLCVIAGFVYTLKTFKIAVQHNAVAERNLLKLSLYIQCLFIGFCMSGNALYDMCMFYTYVIALCIVLSISNRFESPLTKHTAAHFQRAGGNVSE